MLRTVNKTIDASQQSREFVTITNSEVQSGDSRNTGPSRSTMEPEAYPEEMSRQRGRIRLSTSTNQPGTHRVTPPLVTPLVDERASIEEAMTSIVDRIGEQNEQMSLRMSELERAVHVERENLREEINRNGQEVSRSEKRLKERTDEHLAKNLSRMTREAEQRETRLRYDMEKLRSQQEQTLGTLDTRVDSMLGKRTQAIMDRLEGLLGNRNESRSRQATLGEPNREPRVNFNEQANRRSTYGSTRVRGSSSSYATGDNRPRGKNIRGGSNGNRPTSNERPMQNANATGRCDSTNWSHAGQGRNLHSDSNSPELLSEGDDAQAGHSRDATSMATAFEPLNRSLETFLTRLFRTSERSEKSRRVFKKPICYKDESDGCIDNWIEVMNLQFEEEDLARKARKHAITSNLEGTAVNCVMAKTQYQRDSAEKIFEILLNRFGSGVQGHQAMMRFEKRRAREEETIDKFLDDLEMLRMRSQPNESNSRMNPAVASKLIDGVKNDELRTMFATHYTPLSTNAPTTEKLRLKPKECLLLKPSSTAGYYKNIYGNFNNRPANQDNNWFQTKGRHGQETLLCKLQFDGLSCISMPNLCPFKTD